MKFIYSSNISFLLLLLSAPVLGWYRAAIDAFLEPARLTPELDYVNSPPVQKSHLQKRASPFLNSNTQKFVVNGTAIPNVTFDIGESYAGLLPISSALNETRQLYFWFFPSINPNPGNNITIWFNGGPGCSSLAGLLTENGPFLWEAGTLAPTPNPYSWVNLTNMLWVEQPVGVGFTQGKSNITNEVQLAAEFLGFYRNFVDTFQLRNWTTFLTGESYAGTYVPYIADAFLSANDTSYFNLGGVNINDPLIGDRVSQQIVPALPFADYWSNLFYFNATYNRTLHQYQDYCNYSNYLNKYLTFPPPQTAFPSVFPSTARNINTSCGMQSLVTLAAQRVNPCFNIYHVTDTCPFLYSVLGAINVGDYVPPGAAIFFNRTDVQKAINAPVGTNWKECNSGVFSGGGDQSLGPAQDGVLQRVIEKTNNVIIGSGNLDFILPTNGTLLALQNTTWNGLRGFQQYPLQNALFVPYHREYNRGRLSGSGIAGAWGMERGLTFYAVQLSGHELPEYAPGAAYRSMELLLGRIANMSVISGFTTQPNNYTGNNPNLSLSLNASIALL